MSKKVRRLFEGFQPTNYQLSLAPDRDSMKITGTVTITGAKKGRPSQRLAFHQHGVKVVSATITKQDKKGAVEIPVTRINNQDSLDEVRLHADVLLYPGSYTVTMAFESKIQDSMHGTYFCNYEVNGQKKNLIATQFESHHARETFPCIDEPEAKATFALTLVSPEGETAISNMPAVSQSTENGKLTTVFETSPRMSTYLLAFIIGDMQYKETTTKDGVAVRVWSTKAQPLESLDFGLDVARRAIEFFNEFYSVPYPLTKCDHVALPDFSSGAMENWGLITYREICLLADPKTTSQSGRETIALVISHELSHQWFGNLVTMKWWDDLWLNESFANVMEYLAPNTLFPDWNVWNTFIAQEGLSAIRRDSIAGVQAVRTEVHHPDDINTLFDPSIVYAKGGRLIKMLLEYLGEDNFRHGLKRYFTDHAYGNTTGDDLWKALGEASGKDVASFMNPWLQKSGFPVITVDQQGTEVELSQSHFLLDPAKADPKRIWPVPLLSSNTSIPALLDKKSFGVKLTDSKPVRINQGAQGHYVVHYKDEGHVQAIAEGIAAHELGIPERLMLLSDSSMLARAGFQSFAVTMSLLEYYADEANEQVWDIMSLIIGDCRRFIDLDPEIEPRIKALIRTLIDKQYNRLGWTEEPGEPVEDTKLRATIIALGVYAEYPEIVQHALELFELYKTDPDAILSELRGIIFGAAIRNNVEGAFKYLLDIEESTSNVDLKQDAIGALTITKDAAHISALLDRLKDQSKVRQQDVDRQMVYLMRNRHARRISWDWLRANWKWVEETFASDKSYDYFPRYAASSFNTRDYLEEYKTFFGPMQDQVALARNITMGIEELETRVAWLERDIEAVRQYLSA